MRKENNDNDNNGCQKHQISINKHSGWFQRKKQKQEITIEKPTPMM
jgi:hypothetical protein